MKDWGTYRKLFDTLSPSFERLPFQVRCLAGEVLRRCDRVGRIIPGTEFNDELVADFAFHVRAHAGEEAFLSTCLERLLADGYLVFDGGYLVIRNFVDAQRTASADRMALKRARDAARRMDDELPGDGAEPGDDGPPPEEEPSDVGDTGDETRVTLRNVAGVSRAPARVGLVSSGLVLSSPEGSAKNKGSSNRGRAKAPKSEHVPALLPEDWQPDPEQAAALASKYNVTLARILAEVGEFRWYWLKGKGTGSRKSPRGWAQTFGNRIEMVAQKGTLFLAPRGPMPTISVQNGGVSDAEVEARRRSAAEVERRAREQQNGQRPARSAPIASPGAAPAKGTAS